MRPSTRHHTTTARLVGASAALLLGLAGCAADDGTGPADAAVDAAEETTAAVEEEPVDEAPEDEAAVEEVADEDEGEGLTLSQQNAISSAENYLSVMAFSRSGLIGQLEFEDYSTEDATFAVDHLEVDWNEQAAKKAQEYLDAGSFSRQGLIDQLVFEGFTEEEAEHGVTEVGY